VGFEVQSHISEAYPQAPMIQTMDGRIVWIMSQKHPSSWGRKKSGGGGARGRGRGPLKGLDMGHAANRRQHFGDEDAPVHGGGVSLTYFTH